jgi:hypothetical protein
MSSTRRDSNCKGRQVQAICKFEQWEDEAGEWPTPLNASTKTTVIEATEMYGCILPAFISDKPHIQRSREATRQLSLLLKLA